MIKLFTFLPPNLIGRRGILSVILVVLLVTWSTQPSSSQIFQDTKVVIDELLKIKYRLKCNAGKLTELLNSIDYTLGSSADKKDINYLSILSRTLRYVKGTINDSMDDLDMITSDPLKDYRLSEYTAFFMKDSAIKRGAIINKIHLLGYLHGETENTAILDLMDKARGVMHLSHEILDKSIKGLLLLKAAQ